MVSIANCPASLKPISHYLKLAQEHDTRDPVVSYWSRLYALQTGIKLSKKEPDEQMYLLSIMDWLEAFKKEHQENEAITSEVVGQAHLENYALRLFQYADKNDRESNFNKNVVKAFYSAGQVYDVLAVFGELTDEALHNRKYAKWKAAYIHNCLKNGETPIPGPMATEGDDEFENAVGGQPPGAPIGFVNPPTDQPGPGPSYTGERDTSGTDEFDPLKLPAPPKDPEKSPGGFKPFVPTDNTSYEIETPTQRDPNLLSVELTAKAQKYCKWASSALNFDDVPTAIDNLQKALKLLQTGQDG